MNEQKKCIFLVDDSIVYLNTGKTALEPEYTVITIPSGEKLLPLLGRHKPDLILLDIEMPGMDGYQTLQIIKENPATADIPVIFLTSKSDTENEVYGFSIGAVDYITKPFSRQILLKRVGLHLQLQDQKNELVQFNSRLMQMVEERTRDISALQDAVITWAADIIEFRDQETGQHVERVQRYLQILLDGMQRTGLYSAEIADWDIEAFLKSALLHDVGKIKISDQVLLKPARLTEAEFETVKQHTLYGKQLIESLQEKVPSQAFLAYATELAYQHHERWDGQGYPEGLYGDKIPLQARLMALADVYDALISERPYKAAFSHDQAMQIIQEGRGSQFDPDLTDLFVSLSEQIREVSEVQ